MTPTLVTYHIAENFGRGKSLQSVLAMQSHTYDITICKSLYSRPSSLLVLVCAQIRENFRGTTFIHSNKTHIFDKHSN